MDERLKTAAEIGDVHMLCRLIDNNPDMLDTIEKVPFINTPMHIAASWGKVQFAKKLMILKPSFARKLNQDGYTPLHLALFNRQTDMVLEFIQFQPDLISVQGRGGLTALLYLAEKGVDNDHQEEKLQLLPIFLSAWPLSLQDKTTRRETAFHIAVNHDNLDSLNFLLGKLQEAYNESKIINLKDLDGNTVLHTATRKNQPRVVRILLEKSKIDVNAKNSKCLTALDISNQAMISNPDDRSREVAESLKNARAVIAESLPEVSDSINHLMRSKLSFIEHVAITFIRFQNSAANEYSRYVSLVVAVMIATVAYQVLLSPPAGVWQDDYDNDNDNDNNSSSSSNNNNNKVAPHRAGTVIMGTRYFSALYFYNSITLFASIIFLFLVLPTGKIGKLLIGPFFFYLLFYINSMGVIWPYSPDDPLKFILTLILLLLYGVGICGMVILHIARVKFMKKLEHIGQGTMPDLEQEYHGQQDGREDLALLS